MKSIWMVFLFLGFVCSLSGQDLVSENPSALGFSPERLSRIDQMVTRYVEEKKISGAVFILVRDGKVAYHKAFGYRSVEKKDKLQRDDIFRIASQSKAITSLAVMMLFEEGKFLLDEPVSLYIPEFKSPQVLKDFNPKDSSYTTVPAKGEITIRHLLTHTSGIDYAAIGSPEFKAIYAKAGIPSGIGIFSENVVLGEKMRALGKLPLRHNPGEKFTYGLNSDVLGYLVEIWSGMPFDEFLQKRIFEPLGMKDTYFYLPKRKQNRLVSLYENTDNGIKKVDHPIYDGSNLLYPNLEKGKYFSGGAGLSSTVEDYAKFLQVFLNGGMYNGVRLLSRKTVTLMLTDQLKESMGSPFGLGFGLETSGNDHQSIVSLGSFSWGGAFNTHYWADPQEKLIGMIFTQLYNTRYWSIGSYFQNLSYQALGD